MGSPPEKLDIFSLPDEMLSQVLRYLDCRDMIHFSRTCKQFNNFVQSDQSCWKHFAKTKLPKIVSEILVNNCDGDWLKDVKNYYMLKNRVYNYVANMSANHYWNNKEAAVNGFGGMFQLATHKPEYYYYTLHILAELHNKALHYEHPADGPIKRPYSLTDMHYTTIVLRSLVHVYLMVRWHQIDSLGHILPEHVHHFFFQWIDTTHIHLEKDNLKIIDDLTTKTVSLLSENHPLRTVSEETKAGWAKAFLTDNVWNTAQSEEVLAAVRQVLFVQTNMAVTPEVSLDTINIKKVLRRNISSSITILTLFEAVARRCGVCCKLVAFPNHLYLEWKETSVSDITTKRTSYLVNHISGELEIKRQCPYSSPSQEVGYCPRSMMQSLYSCYSKFVGNVRDWTADNRALLLSFFGYADHDNSRYRFLAEHVLFGITENSPVVVTPMDITHMSPVHKDIILDFVKYSNSYDEDEDARTDRPRCPKVKRHESTVSFAVGMLCYHTKYQYVCVLRGWDTKCQASAEWKSKMGVHELIHGENQPFYNVIASDNSQRYVAQENLNEVPQSHRIHHLEPLLAREFSHFDQYSYVPNAQKQLEYPDDEPIRRHYKTLAYRNRRHSTGNIRSTRTLDSDL